VISMAGVHFPSALMATTMSARFWSSADFLESLDPSRQGPAAVERRDAGRDEAHSLFDGRDTSGLERSISLRDLLFVAFYLFNVRRTAANTAVRLRSCPELQRRRRFL